MRPRPAGYIQCMQPYNTGSGAPAEAPGLDVLLVTPTLSIIIVDCFRVFFWVSIAGRLCDNDIEVSDRRRVLVVSSAKLCGSADKKTAGAGGCYPHDGTSYHGYIVSVLQPDGPDIYPGMGRLDNVYGGCKS
jgi:hypothetical protein